MTALLLSKGADVTFRGCIKGWVPLHHAATHKDIEVTKLLIESGADVNICVRASDGDSSRYAGITPLHCAISCCQTKQVRFLIDQGADCSTSTVAGETTLALTIYRACLYNSEYHPPLKVLRILLEVGFNPFTRLKLYHRPWIPYKYEKSYHYRRLHYPVSFPSHIEFARKLGAGKKVIETLSKGYQPAIEGR